MPPRIRSSIITLVALGLLLVINMLYNYIRWTIPVIFINLEQLPAAYGYGADADFPFSNRLYFFGITLASVISGLVAVGIGFRLMYLFWKGVFFDAVTTTTIRHLGIALIAVALISILYASLTPYVMTQARADGGVPLTLRLNSFDMGYALCGLLMYMIGWVLGEALRLEQENKEFI